MKFAASLNNKGSQSAQGDRNVAFFVVYQWVRVAASFYFFVFLKYNEILGQTKNAKTDMSYPFIQKIFKSAL